MSDQKPTIGRIVIYRLTASDAEKINRRRTTGAQIAERIPDGRWPLGAQAHIGNEARPDQDYPMVIVSVWPSGQGSVNGQVMLDGNDTLWVTSAVEYGPDGPDGTDARGRWRWPARTADNGGAR